MNNPVGKTANVGEQWSAGVAYVALPSDVERAAYIRDCYVNNCLCLWSENSGFLNRVPVSDDILNFIEFPLEIKQFGSAVVFVTEPIHQQPIIVARLNKTDKVGELRENQFKFKRTLLNNIVEVSGSAESGSLNLIVHSEKGGEVNISLSNLDNNGKIKLSVAGDVSLEASKKIEITQGELFSVKTIGEEKESTLQQDEQGHKFSGEKFIIGDEKEAMVLGNQLSSILKELITQIAAITVTTIAGPSPILNMVQINLIKEKVDQILSTQGFLEK